MVKKVFLMLFFKILIVNAQQLEEKIYDALDAFLEVKTEQAFSKFIQQEKEFIIQVKTKKEHLALVILQCNKGFFLKENNIQQAIFTYENAWKRYSKEKLANYDIVAYCLKPLGNLYTKTKDYANAEFLIKHYIFLAEKENNIPQKIAGIINLSKVYQSVNKHDLVVGMIDDVLKKYKIDEVQKYKLNAIKKNSLVILGVKLEKDFDSELYQKLKEEDVFYFKYKASLQQKNYINAEAFFKNFKNKVSYNDLTNREKAKFYLEEAQLYLLLKQEEKTNTILEEALVCLLPNYKKNKIVSTKELCAESLLTDVFDMKAVLASSIKDALSYYDKSFFVADLIVQNITSQETKIILQANQRNRGEACILLLLEEYNITKEKEYLEKALLYAEIGKSDVLKNRLVKRRLQSKYPNDTLLQFEKNFIKQQQVLTHKIVEIQTTANDSGEIASLNKKLNNISSEIRKLQFAIREKYAAQEEVVGIDKIKAKIIGDDSALLLYFFGRKNIYQFIVSNNSIKVNTIELNKELEKLIISYIQLFNSSVSINNDVANYTSKAFEVYQKIKFSEVASYKNVIIIPDGILNFVPFETLLSAKTEELFFVNMSFIIKQQTIVYSFNLFTFLNTQNKLKEQRVLGVFPVFKNTPKELTYSLEEAAVIKNDFSTIIFKNKKATKNNFINSLNKTDIIHLSTHSGNLGFSISPSISFYDEELTLNELYSKESTANLAVLSACETGVGTLLKGTSPLSMARGFNYIGVDNLVFSLWKINDKSTALLMKDFYKSLKKTNSISYANHKAKLSYLQDKSIENFRKSPYYWGAFVYYGASDFSEENNQTFYVIVFFALLVVLLLIFKRII